MSDNIKLIIEIPKPIYESVQNGTYCGTLYKELKNGTPLDSVKKKITEAYADTRGMFPNYASGLTHAYKIIDECVGKAESEEI